ncbi:hypothetical protein [Romboutsia sp.]|uniref:hypothetical protein n=1 Tax=Romboutsia sp. TaxID=1965302 RepID=UPI002C826FB2|nr:hypothetical protein [Romboutsia sp.]HSQ88583.1 hypothetical protein [Romboutsia sp.]
MRVIKTILVLLFLFLVSPLLSGCSLITDYQEYSLSDVYDYNEGDKIKISIPIEGREYKKVIIPGLYDKLTIKGPYAYGVVICGDFDDISNISVQIALNGEITQKYSMPETVSIKKMEDESYGSLFLVKDHEIDIDNDKLKYLDMTVEFDGIKGEKSSTYTRTVRFYPKNFIYHTNLFWEKLMSV